MKSTMRQLHRILVGLIGIAVFVQFFSAGLWHSGVTQTPEFHVFTGLGIVLASLIALIAAVAGKLPRPVITMTAIVFVLILLQPILIEQRRAGLPLISALHPLNGGIIGMLSGKLAAMRAPEVETTAVPAAAD